VQRHERDAREPVGRRGAELGEPVVVGAERRGLEFRIANAEELEREARVDDLRDHAVALLVAEPRRRVPAAGPHALVTRR
jgi:hypothetical protein